MNGAGAKLPQAVGRRPTTAWRRRRHEQTAQAPSTPGFSPRSGRAGPDTDGGKISPHGRTPVRARYFGPLQGVACWAPRQGRGIRSHSARHVRRVGLAPAVRGRGRTGRAIGLPRLSATVARLKCRRGWISRAVTRSRTRVLTARFQRRYGYCEDVGVHTPRLSPFSVVTPSSRGWCPSMSAGRTPRCSRIISALELP